jgi:hypothetical protein
MSNPKSWSESISREKTICEERATDFEKPMVWERAICQEKTICKERANDDE